MARNPGNCVICGGPLDQRWDAGGRLARQYQCPRCGRFELDFGAAQLLESWLGKQDTARRTAIIQHILRKAQLAHERPPSIDEELAKQIIKTGTLPSPQEQVDNLVRYLGDTLPGIGEFIRLTFRDHGPVIGAQSEGAFDFVVSWLGGLANIKPLAHGVAEATRSFSGWRRYEELRRGAASGRNAFMAMPYGNAVLSGIVRDHFVPAVKQAGFTLKRLDDEPKAGLLDARLMLAIKAAWFLVADVTDGNPGAYWEAAYAFGLGKPVIYTCERAVWDKRKSHFDTNHHQHVVWDAANMPPAIRDLKATIRFTIPEAKQQDD